MVAVVVSHSPYIISEMWSNHSACEVLDGVDIRTVSVKKLLVINALDIITVNFPACHPLQCSVG